MCRDADVIGKYCVEKNVWRRPAYFLIFNLKISTYSFYSWFSHHHHHQREREIDNRPVLNCTGKKGTVCYYTSTLR
jgi:hypothetical protein